jgi:hypothetical protein
MIRPLRVDSHDPHDSDSHESRDCHHADMLLIFFCVKLQRLDMRQGVCDSLSHVHTAHSRVYRFAKSKCTLLGMFEGFNFIMLRLKSTQEQSERNAVCLSLLRANPIPYEERGEHRFVDKVGTGIKQ